MKKIWIVLVVAAVAVAAFLIRQHTKEKDAEEIQVAVEAVSAISEHWNVDVLKARADPGLIKAMGSQGQSAEELLRIYSTLGALKQPPVCVVRTTGEFMKGGERHHTVSFECNAEYEKGPAAVSLTLQNSESAPEWLIYYINLRSDVFGDVGGAAGE